MSAARIGFFALILLAAPASAKPCNASEAALLGAWVSSKGGFFEEMAFEHDADARVFNSWLHHRPELLGGRWSLAGCRLRITDPRGDGLAFDYVIESLSRRTLILRETSDGASARYRRISSSR